MDTSIKVLIIVYICLQILGVAILLIAFIVRNRKRLFRRRDRIQGQLDQINEVVNEIHYRLFKEAAEKESPDYGRERETDM